MKVLIGIYVTIVVFKFSFLYATIDFCRRPNFQLSDDTYMNKDIDICTMFMQSYIDSVEMKMPIQTFLLKHLPKQYLYSGHLHSFTQYPNNYTFLLASTIDRNEEQNKDHNKYTSDKKFYNPSEDDNQFKYASIDWNQSYTEILDDISKKFQIIDECSSIITFYLIFPSYPDNNLLLNFFKNFENKLDVASTAFPFNNEKNFYYRQDINPSFLSFADALPLTIFQQLLQHYPNVRLVLCGHGLGGTIAQLSALHLLSTGVSFHYTQLRSISIGSLFFAKEPTINFIKNHQLEKHFINIYHEMDPVPSLFNIAELLSKLIYMSEQEGKKSMIEKIWSTIRSLLPGASKSIETNRFYLKYILTWLCRSLSAKFSTISPEICNPNVVDMTTTYFKKFIDYSQKLFPKDTLPKLLYQPIGIYNMISFRKLDRTWHLINVIDTPALYDHLNSALERLSRSEQIFEHHSISTYIIDLQQCNKQKSGLTKTETLSNVVASFQSKVDLEISDINKEKTSLSSSESNYSIIISLPFRFSDNLYDQFCSGASYMSMIAVPPVYSDDTSPRNDLKRKFLSAIKYRTGLSKLNSNDKQKSSTELSIYDTCLSIYETFGMDARMELMKLQLDQRMLVPILISNKTSLSFPFRSYIKTLSLVETPVLQSEENLLAKDLRLLRIGLISTIQGKIGGLPDLIQNVFQATSMRQPIPRTGTEITAKTIMETGYGFLPDRNPPLYYRPVIVTHIIGDYRPLLSFLVQYIDALIIEYNDDDKNFAFFDYNDVSNSLHVHRIMKWKHTADAEFHGVPQLDESYDIDEFEGSAREVTYAFQNHLLEISSFLPSTSSRSRLIDIVEDTNLFIDDDIPLIDTEILFKNFNTAQLKRKQFQLQQSYKKEAESQLELDNLVLQLNDDRRKQLDKNIRRERENRSKMHKKIANIRLLQSYISIAAESNNEKRYIQKRQFEFVLSEYNEKTVSTLREKIDETLSAMAQATIEVLRANEKDTSFSSLKRKEKQATDKYYAAQQSYIDTFLVIDHFWREISHLYLTNKILYKTFPDLAAQHLIDGFSLELLDGDSMLLNVQWLEHVFNSLTRKLNKELDHPARIFVLSIWGPKSSGKSSLLKTMYGIRIRSSFGACTQGVNMMLVKVLHRDYDYILLLDTEGIRAPEFSFLANANVRDNTLAAFAVLPADGTILLNKGEVNQALEEVLPIVMYLYATSSLSLKLGGQIPSKLFFVYNQIDPGQERGGMELLQDLTTRLHNITDEIRNAMSLQNISFHGFEQFRLDFENKSNSDFRMLSINTYNPPINHPVYLFGEECLQLRQWIDQRITNTSEIPRWKARSISDILEYVKAVNHTIHQGSHILNVSSLLEMLANNKLNESIERIKYEVSSNYSIIRTDIESNITRFYTNSSKDFTISVLSPNAIENEIIKAHNLVLDKMQEIILKAEEKIFKLIKGTKRETSFRDDWISFLQENKSHNRKLLAARIEREITNAFFEEKVKEKNSA